MSTSHAQPRNPPAALQRASSAQRRPFPETTPAATSCGPLSMIAHLGITEQELDEDIRNGDRSRTGSPILKMDGSGKYTSQDLEDHWKGLPYQPAKKRKSNLRPAHEPALRQGSETDPHVNAQHMEWSSFRKACCELAERRMSTAEAGVRLWLICSRAPDLLASGDGSLKASFGEVGGDHKVRDLLPLPVPAIQSTLSHKWTSSSHIKRPCRQKVAKPVPKLGSSWGLPD